MAQRGNHPGTNTRQLRQHWQNLVPHQSTVPNGQRDEKTPATKILTNILFQPDQHDIQPKRSTCTALSTITADIAVGYSRKKLTQRTVLVALDLTAAFDNVDHQQLLDCVDNANIPATFRRWLYNYVQKDEPKFIFCYKNLRPER